MKRLLAIALLTACTSADSDTSGGGGKGDDPTSRFVDQQTDWELAVGTGGDAVVNQVTSTPDGKLLVTSHYPRWLRRVTKAGTLDKYFDVTAHDVWPVDATQFVATVGDGALFELQSFRADGSLNPAFGSAGRVHLPYTYDTYGTLALTHDPIGHRVLAVFVRDFYTFNANNVDYPLGPKHVDLIAFDDKTGVASPAESYTLPPWDNDDYTNLPKLQKLVARPDGSVLLLVSEALSAAPTYVATQWSAFHLDGGHVTKSKLARTGYSDPLVGFTRLANGSFDMYLSGMVEGLGDDKKLRRISLDTAFAPQIEDLGPALDYAHCAAAVATPDGLVYGHSEDQSQPIHFTAFPKGGAPIEFQSDRTKRCLLTLGLGDDDHIYASTWDTTNVAWTAQLTSLSPR